MTKQRYENVVVPHEAEPSADALSGWALSAPKAFRAISLYNWMAEHPGPIKVSNAVQAAKVSQPTFYELLDWLDENEMVTVGIENEKRVIRLRQIPSPPEEETLSPSFGMRVLKHRGIDGEECSPTASRLELTALRTRIVNLGVSDQKLFSTESVYKLLRALPQGEWMLKADLAPMCGGYKALWSSLGALRKVYAIQRLQGQGEMVEVFPITKEMEKYSMDEITVFLKSAAGEATEYAKANVTPKGQALFLCEMVDAIGAARHRQPSGTRGKDLLLLSTMLRQTPFDVIRSQMAFFFMNPAGFEERIQHEMLKYGISIRTFQKNYQTIADGCADAASAYKTDKERWWKGPMLKAGLEEFCN